MTNNQIADSFKLLSKLMDIHGENSFKSKSYASAAFSIEKLEHELATLDNKNFASLRGVGASSAKKIIELLSTGSLQDLNELMHNTPAGILEMMQIKGIGPKKIHTIWKEMEIESVGELLYACQENRLKLYKGFGEKTQTNIENTLSYYLQNKDSHLFASVVEVSQVIQKELEKIFMEEKVFVTGEYKRQMTIITQLSYIIIAEAKDIIQKVKMLETFHPVNDSELIFSTDYNVDVKLIATGEKEAIHQLIKTSSAPEYYNSIAAKELKTDVQTEEDFFDQNELLFIPAPARNAAYSASCSAEEVAGTIQEQNVKGLIHCHSKWSDGAETIETMAKAAMEKGLEYMLITDHSKSAFYAQGLWPEKIVEQHKEIDALNESLQPFKIFKGIESDILNDGSLDYEVNVLASFDLIIASIHSNLKMTEEKAMHRILTAVANPYTSILGHPTGRLLLSREGYPLDFSAVIDHCAAHNVCIEINANPRRLDMDWEHIEYAKKKKVLLSINPDAHSVKGIDDIKYGVLAAQKALLQTHENLSSYSLHEMEVFVENQKRKRIK